MDETSFDLARIKKLKLTELRNFLPDLAFDLSRSSLETILYEERGCVVFGIQVKT